MVPAYVPNPVAALCGGGTPIDFDRNHSDGRRLLGDGKTYRGLACGVLAGITVGALQIWLTGLGVDLPAAAYGCLHRHPLAWGTPRGHGKEFLRAAGEKTWRSMADTLTSTIW